MMDPDQLRADTRYAPMPRQLKVPIHPSGWTRKESRVRSRYRKCENSGNENVDAKNAIQSFLGLPLHVAFYQSGSAALLAVLLALDLPVGSEILLPAFNCPSVVEAIIAAQLSPVFFDVLPDGTPCPDSLRQGLSAQSRAVLFTHLFGKTGPGLQQTLMIAKDMGLHVIDDASQSFGAHNADGHAGTFGTAGILSFGRTKPVSCWGGGAVVTSDCSLQQKLRRQDGVSELNIASMNVAQREIRLRSYSPLFLPLWQRLGWLSPLEIDTLPVLMKQTGLAQDLSCQRIAPLCAQLLTSQLPMLAKRQQKAAEQAQWLTEHLCSIDDLILPEGDYPNHVFTHFMVHLRSRQRYQLASHLSHLGVQSTWFYYPLHYLPPYAYYRRTALPRTEEIWSRFLAIPCRDISSKSLQRVYKGVRSFYECT